MRAPLHCWSCGVENDLDTAQTCRSCGAPLVKSRAVFSKSTLLAVLVLGLLLQGFCVFSRFLPR